MDLSYSKCLNKQAASLRDGNLQNAITLWSIHLFRKMKVANLVKKKSSHQLLHNTPHPLPPTKKNYGVFNSPPLDPVLRKINPVCTHIICLIIVATAKKIQFIYINCNMA